MYRSFFAKPPPPSWDLLDFLRYRNLAEPALVSEFTTTCREYCKSMDCTRPAFACHCEKFSMSIRNLPVKSPEPKWTVTA
jgi:hypothetical protein